MKNSIFFLFAMAFIMANFLSTQSHAQVDVTINPVGALFGDLSVGADFVINEKFSVEGTVGYKSGKAFGKDLKYSSVPVTAVGKLYVNPKNGADRFYVNSFVKLASRSYTHNNVESEYAEYTRTKVGLGFGLGYKVVSDGGFTFDIGFGLGRRLADQIKYKENGVKEEAGWSNMMTMGKLAIGYRFGGR